MNNNHDNSIMQVLAEAGESGISVKKLARHVFNASHSFFEPVTFDEVYRYVQAFVRRNSKGSEALLTGVGHRGHYCLNPSSAQSQQLLLMFCDEEKDEKAVETKDLSLSLF
ncbi:MAG: hypothetical protein SOZ80_02740 [Prevotella sp.]|uniref:hypothetical protein n=1 Tax=Prevotella sp. TaxID=59823 RepID=UPI002A3388EF|nr:hypothetical protein [Prevotella sp.]MDD7318314.1 hypothetical protein [Prevotellaceae bacterium]MDY4019682.1 hypothetical protein [Prevotella sp.]